MVKEMLVGIDLGTTGAKAVVLEVGSEVRTLAATYRELAIDTPHPGWAEQDPQAWWRAAAEAVQAALAQSQASPGCVAGIGLSGQMHGTVCLDRAGNSLRPAILWADRRSAGQASRVERQLGHERLAAWTANPLAPGFMLSTWLWLQENEPETARRTARLLLPKDTLRLRMTGEAGSEPSDACSTALFDPLQRTWCQPLLDALHIDPSLLPPLGESAQVAGLLQAQAAEPLGLSAGIPVVFGAADQAAQAVGHGVLEPGLVSSTIGTGGQLLSPTRPSASGMLAPDPGLRLHLYCHALPGLWYRMAATLSAGLSLRWLREVIWNGTAEYAHMADAAAGAPPGAGGLFFLPYLAGERTPLMDPQARAGFIGLDLRHGRPHLTRAVMEGVVFALRQGLDLMRAQGIDCERLVASGGGSRHPLWRQLQADIFNLPVYRTQTVEAAAAGAALLAGVGAGLFPDLAAACRRFVRWEETPTLPDPERTAFYESAYQIFSQLYPAIKQARIG